MARRLGWLGPAIVAVGVAIAGFGVYLVIHNKPKPGAVVETIALDDRARLVVRAEDGGPRSFLELRVDDDVKWQALIPPYAGRPGAPGIAWNEIAVSVRVIRDHKAEVFALSMHDASKLGGIHLGEGHGAITPDATGPLTLTDHIRSYELISGDGWHQMVGIDLTTGKRLWKTELGPAPIIHGEVQGGLIVLDQGGTRRYFQVFTGREDRSSETTGIPLVPPKPAP
jgi:outer membrane protein assembly factor BamB